MVLEKYLLWLKHMVSALCGNGVERVVNGAFFFPEDIKSTLNYAG